MPLDDPTELFYWVDENDQELGSMLRSEAHSGSRKIHRSVHIVIENEQNQILLQQRSQNKDTYPGLWTVSVAGHVTHGRSYLETAQREAEEELGIKTYIKDENLTEDAKLNFTKVGKLLLELPKETELTVVYKMHLNKLPSYYDQAEISQINWFSKQEVQQMRAKQQLTPSAVMILEALGYLNSEDNRG